MPGPNKKIAMERIKKSRASSETGAPCFPSERKAEPFSTFDDLKKRVTLLPDPQKIIVKRILEEIDDKDKYRVFVPRMEKGSRPGSRRR